MSTATLHWVNADVEVHKLVVGPYDNNVFVVRCRRTGEAALIDAANEHEQLLELCQRLGVRRVLETHGHWDHIQAVPAIREAGYEVAVTKLDAPKLADVGYDVFLDDAEVIEVGQLRLDAIHNPGHTPGSISFHVRDTPLLFTGDTLVPRRARQHELRRRRLRDDHPLDRGPPVHVPRHDRACSPGTASTRRSAPSAPTWTSGSPAAGSRTHCASRAASFRGEDPIRHAGASRRFGGRIENGPGPRRSEAKTRFGTPAPPGASAAALRTVPGRVVQRRRPDSARRRLQALRRPHFHYGHRVNCRARRVD